MRYRVQFFYYTDLRCDFVVTANSDMAALALALSECQTHNWIKGEKGFRIIIEAA